MDWRWIPSLYFAEGLPYTLVISLSVILYKKLDISNADIALYTSWLYLPWVIKPFWSPVVDLLKSKRWWIVTMQFILGVGMAGVAFTIPTPFFFQSTLAFFWLLAFSSATHDIAADGFYMLELDTSGQAFFVGIRNTFYRLSMIFGQGGLVFCAGWLEKYIGSISFAWSITFFITSGIFLILFLYHRFALPHPVVDKVNDNQSFHSVLQELWFTIRDFFSKKGFWLALFFILTYRLGEAQLLKMASPFLLDPNDKGGLGLDTETVGIVYGIVGLIALMLGGILGGIAISQGGIRRWIIPMALALTLPSFSYVYLAYTLSQDLFIINSLIALEQFGYGFGFTAYTVYMMQFSNGRYKTAHFAFCTGLMAAGMMLPGMFSGAIQENIGYPMFFLWTIVCAIPGLLASVLIYNTHSPKPLITPSSNQ